MTTPENASAWPDHKPTALLVLADGTVLEGFGLGAEGQAEAFSGMVMSALHSRRMRLRQSRKARIHMQNTPI